ncbi:uncharacterized protein [Eurosta solidaginis]|uniref:uncharacterized protein n=1 Tax=Eurosta solidaginis TaxID=178769 RepID=UPI003530D911
MRKAEKDFLKYELESLYSKKDEINAELLSIHLRLAEQLPTTALMECFDRIKTEVDQELQQKYRSLNRKLDKLAGHREGNQNQNTHQFHDKFVNLTTVAITKEEAQFLEKGLKHNIMDQNTVRKTEQAIVDAEIAISLIPQEEQEHARHMCREIIKKEVKAQEGQKSNTEEKTIKNLRHKLRKNNIVTTKADKGNTTVLIEKEQYISKTEDLIGEMKCRRMREDPTDEYQKQIKVAIKNATNIVDSNMAYRLVQMNPSAPPLVVLPKIHKPDTPMRPIINFKSAPCYKLSKYLKTILIDTLELRNEYAIANTTELIERLETVELTRNSKLVSFDIKDLYTSIPLSETLDIVSSTIVHNTKNKVKSMQITNTLRATLRQNYFQFNNKIYRQTNGLGMGSPTSAILMEVFMQNLEEKYKQELKSKLGV